MFGMMVKTFVILKAEFFSLQPSISHIWSRNQSYSIVHPLYSGKQIIWFDDGLSNKKVFPAWITEAW